MKWNIRPIELELKFDWKISRNTSTKKTNYVIEVEEGDFKAKGEVAPNIRYGEDGEKILQEFTQFLKEKPQKFDSIEELTKFLKSLDISYSLKFGIEAAFVDYISQISDLTKYRLLGTNSVTQIKTSFSIPIMETEKLADFINEYKLERFDELKIKIDKSSVEAVQVILGNYPGKLRLDANEAFENADEVLAFLAQIDCERISFLEQPLKADNHDEALSLKEKSPVMIFADESLTHHEVSQYYAERFHGVNIKLMKAGSYFQALKQMRRAKELGLKTMIGCMVESSLGISQTFPICQGADYLDLDGCLLIKNDPFNLVTEEKGRLFFSHLH
ncbi:mandelate racemase/muconate lactonizing enzyme, C-terminal domain protein [Bacteriovorax sp. BSW11_IV]|uniref:enolase C-terminal domain-like protein n=1 Tax=Bacteriovorax sp. BSW11_IV TaxID=1353529 RepID=UPI000389F4FA|nr:enolase C-terminal domain-like protein [Bacteriovorax sp. BSW11_IV]EQC49169.1 mandelate racemase/muconate lactonizing enzyme, C-terminal domain protein [Bacteriovorax sp. BSW11_IV]